MLPFLERTEVILYPAGAAQGWLFVQLPGVVVLFAFVLSILRAWGLSHLVRPLVRPLRR